MDHVVLIALLHTGFAGPAARRVDTDDLSLRHLLTDRGHLGFDLTERGSGHRCHASPPSSMIQLTLTRTD